MSNSINDSTWLTHERVMDAIARKHSADIVRSFAVEARRVHATFVAELLDSIADELSENERISDEFEAEADAAYAVLSTPRLEALSTEELRQIIVSVGLYSADTVAVALRIKDERDEKSIREASARAVPGRTAAASGNWQKVRAATKATSSKNVSTLTPYDARDLATGAAVEYRADPLGDEWQPATWRGHGGGNCALITIGDERRAVQYLQVRPAVSRQCTHKSGGVWCRLHEGHTGRHI